MKETNNNLEEKQTEMEFAESSDRCRLLTESDPSLAARLTASIFIDGLSVLCPKNTATEKYVEIGFLKEMHYAAKIHVYRDLDCRILDWSFDCPEDRGVRIEISKTVRRNCTFYKQRKINSRDFGWMPDLDGDDWHGGNILGIKAGAKDHLSAKLVLKDAVLYTHFRSVNDAKQSDLAGNAKLFSNLGRVLGADITCEAEDRSVDIKVIAKDAGGSEQIIASTSLMKENAPFFVVVETKVHEHDRDQDHLPLLYDHIVELPASQRRYGLRYRAPEKDWGFCGLSDKSTEFACQTFGGGCGELPPFP